MKQVVHIPVQHVRHFTKNGMKLLNEIQAGASVKIVDPGESGAKGNIYRVVGSAENVQKAAVRITVELSRLEALSGSAKNRAQTRKPRAH